MEPNMPHVTIRPRYQDVQQPRLYRVGCSLRRGYLTGPSDPIEERMMRRLLERWDEGTLGAATQQQTVPAE